MVEATRLTEPELESLIRSLAGTDEDDYQDIWLAVLERKAFSQEEVTQIAGDIKRKTRKAINLSKLKERSLSEVVLEHDRSKSTLADILPNTFVDEAPIGTEAQTRFMGHRGYKNLVGLDAETASRLKNRYPTWPLGDAIRLMVGLEPLNKRRAWQVWEDNIIKERYPHGGGFACQVELVGRKRKQINQRAMVLGIKVKNRILRGDASWLTVSEVAREIGGDKSWVYGLVHDGFLAVIPLSFQKQKHFLFTSRMLGKFIHDYPFKYRHEKLNGYKHFAPDWLFDWGSLSVAARTLGISKAIISSYTRQHKIPSHYGVHRQTYVRIKDVEAFRATGMTQKEHTELSLAYKPHRRLTEIGGRACLSCGAPIVYKDGIRDGRQKWKCCSCNRKWTTEKGE